MKIAFLFAGQGSQEVGMGQSLYEQYPCVREIYDAIDLDIDVKKLCFEGPKELLDDTANAQSCIVATSLAIASILKEKGIQPDFVAGLSLGEYSALSYAGVMSVKDACEITRQRGLIMAHALPKGTTKMVAVMGMDEGIILECCLKAGAEIANYNCPGQIVITGSNDCVDKTCELLQAQGCRRLIPLNVSGAFHSSLLTEASQQLEKVLAHYTFKQPTIPVVYNVSGKEERPIKDLLKEQMKSSVRFMQSIDYMISQGVDTFIEIGPGRSLSGFVRRINKNVAAYSVNDEASIEKLMKELSKDE